MSNGCNDDRGDKVSGNLARVAPSVRPLVLHISADYPDPYRGPTTTAVERLVTSTRDVDHVVVSLFRTNHPGKTYFRDCGIVGGVRLFAYCYFCLPFGVGLAGAMSAVARRFREMLDQQGLRPAIVHAHKFAFEGLAGLEVVNSLGEDVALFVSVRGEAERRIFRFKPTYLRRLQLVANRAWRIYYVSAWFRPVMDAKLAIDPAKETLLPNIVGNTARDIPSCVPKPRFVCVLNLDIRGRKGLKHLLAAFATFHAAHPDIGLDLIGGGTDKSIAAVKSSITQLNLEGSVRLLGRMDNAELTQALPHYLALALPSFDETFGMVYLEALFAGIPILYSRDTGIDGYLDGIQAGVSVRAGNVAEISQALSELARNNPSYRQAIGRSGRTLHERFDPAAIVAGYRADIERFCKEEALLSAAE